MDYEIQNIVDLAYETLVNFYHSPFVLVLKILIGFYLAVLLIDIILLLILRDTPQNLRVGLKGMDLPLISKKKMKKRWDKIKEKLIPVDNQAQYKIAIIEADAVAAEILSGIGYKGSNMAEQLDQIGKAHLDDHLESLRGAHEIRNRVVNESEFVVDQRMATAVVGVYENFLQYLELLD